MKYMVFKCVVISLLKWTPKIILCFEIVTLSITLKCVHVSKPQTHNYSISSHHFKRYSCKIHN